MHNAFVSSPLLPWRDFHVHGEGEGLPSSLQRLQEPVRSADAHVMAGDARRVPPAVRARREQG